MFVVYDVTKEDSFASCAKWIQGVRKGREDRLPGVLVANKIDLEERRVVDEQRGRDFAKENGLVYFETSALQGNYEGPFKHVAMEFAKKYEETVARADAAKRPAWLEDSIKRQRAGIHHTIHQPVERENYN